MKFENFEDSVIQVKLDAIKGGAAPSSSTGDTCTETILPWNGKSDDYDDCDVDDSSK